MDQRLATWKIHSLSMAARKTLVSSVVSAIPAYTMQSTKLPFGICDAIDKKCRNFLWGSSGTARKVHLVAWEDICRRRDDGGLGLRNARKQNQAFMMKVGWGLVKRRDALWVKFIREKYKCGNDMLPKVNARKKSSNLWKGVSGTWNEIKKGVGWKLGDGQKISFWEDYWLPGFEPLEKYAICQVDQQMRKANVAAYVSASGGWSWHLLLGCLPGMVLNALDRIAPFINGLMEDSPIWRETTDGNFTVRSAYNLLLPGGTLTRSGVWRRIWKLDIPQRYKMFLWLCVRKRLLTNTSKYLRHMRDTENCSLCGVTKETVIHALRGCTVAMSCWQQIVPPQICRRFFSITDPGKWINWNLHQESQVFGVRWPIWFALLCRHIWINRNAGIFEGKSLGFRQIFAKTRAVAGWSTFSLNPPFGITVAHVSWTAPYVGYVKINVDGASSAGGEVAACGGVARDHNGKVLGGFRFRLGRGDSFYAEAWAVLWGLKRAWDCNWRKVVVESDCKELVEILHGGFGEEHRYSDLCTEIQNCLDRDWEIDIGWCRREANTVADILAKDALDKAEGVTFFVEPPECIKRRLELDII